MDPKEILKFCIDKGLLIEPEALKLFSEAQDVDSVKMILDQIKSHTQKRIITKTLFEQNKEQVSEFFLALPEANQKSLEKVKIKLGLEIEISKEVSKVSPSTTILLNSSHEATVNVLTDPLPPKEKLSVGNFVNLFRDRMEQMKGILQEHSDLENLVSVNKLMKGKKVSIIGAATEKRTTKNKNILFEVEDLTGRVRVLVNQNKPELYRKAEELPLDAVVGFTGFGDREIFFAQDIILPDISINSRKKSPIDESAVFISDLQFGSKLFFRKQFDKFIDYLSDTNKDSDAQKIKYLFLLGDLVSGVGVYPNQVKDLEIEDIEEQYKQIAEILSRVRKDIKIIVSPGNHDGVRLMEPQPFLDEKYAWPLYDLENVVMMPNPSYVNIGRHGDFEGFDVLVYHGFSYPYYANNVPSLLHADAINAPDKIMTYLLKHRHLAPTFTSVQVFPSDKDELVIKKIPDIFVSGHLHKSAISYYNNVLIISCSTWEAETENQKRRGNTPDFCKAPLFNLKTGAVKILDFE